MQESETKPEVKRKSRWKKWLKRLLIVLAGLIVTLGLLIYFFFDDLIKTTLYDFVLVESKKVYKLNFNEIDYEFKNSTLTIKGVQLQPDTNRYKKLVKEGGKQKPLYALSIDEIQLQHFNIMTLYYDDRLDIGKILVKDPVVDQIGMHEEEVSKPHKKFIEVLRNVSNKYLKETKIDEFALKNGNFGFYRAIGDTINDAGIDGISIYLKEFRINQDTSFADKRILFSEDIELKLERIEAILINNSHWLTIDSISLSSIDSSLRTHGIDVQPIEALKKSRGERDKLLINLHIPATAFVDVDINRLFFEEYLDSEKLVFRDPVLRLYGNGDRSSGESGKQQIDKQFLFELFSAYLNGFDVKQLLLENGSYTSYFNLNDSLPRTQAERIAFSMNGIRIDSAHLNERQKLIVADEASLVAENLITHLHKFNHRLTIENINLDSRSSSLNMRGMDLEPEGNTTNKFIAVIPDLNVSDVNFTKLFRSGEVIAQSIYIKKPDLTFDLMINAAGGAHTTNEQGRFKMIAFDSLYLDSCSYALRLRDSSGAVQSVMNSSLLLMSLLHDTINFAHTRLFDMDAIDLKQKDFTYIMPRLNRRIQAGMLRISSVDSVVYLKDASLLPIENSAASITGSELPPRIDVSELSLNRVDPVQYFRKRELIAGSLTITDPFIELAEHDKANGDLNISRTLLREKMERAFALAAIQRIDIENFKIGFPLAGSDQILHKIGKHGLSIEVSSFYFSENIPDTNRFLFTENITLNTKDFLLPLPNSPYRLSIKDFYASTRERNIQFTGLKVKGREDKSFSLDLPRFELNRIDFDKLLFEKQIHIGSVELLAPDLHIEPHQADGQGAAISIRNPEFIQSTSIDSISITYGELFYQNPHGTIDSLKADFDFQVFDLDLDKGMTYRFGKDPLISDKIRLNIINVSSTLQDGFYKFSLTDATFRVDTGRIELKGLILQPTNLQQVADLMRKDTIKHAMSVIIPHAIIDGLSFQDLAMSRGLNVENVVFDQTDIGLFSLKATPKKNKEKTQVGMQLHENLPVVSVGNVDFGQVNFKMQQLLADSAQTFILDDLSLKVRRLYMDSSNIRKPHNFMYAEDIEVEKDHYGFITSDDLYTVYFGKLKVSTAEQRVTLDSFSLRPRYEKYEFARRVGHQTDRMVLNAEDISINKLDFSALTGNSIISSDRIDVGRFRFEAFRDKSVPFPEDQRRGMPRQMLKQIPLTTVIDTIVLSKGRITYGERMHKGWSDGEVILDDFKGTLTGMNNNWSNDDTLAAEVDFKLMKEGDAHIKLEIPLGSKADTFIMHGGLSRMDLSAFNSMTRSLFGVAIKKGKGEVDDIRMHGNADNVSGELIFPFRKLKIQLINPRTGERGGIGDGIMTFLANEILLRSNNPRFLRKIRVGTIYAPRDPKRSIFNYIWKGVLSGIESTLGYSNKEQRQQRRELRKKQRKDN